jgi:hypothetical protein
MVEQYSFLRYFLLNEIKMLQNDESLIRLVRMKFQNSNFIILNMGEEGYEADML